jgi:glucosamine 6-phosphate synthetase-like amidotransferase/phosphosugar isomerase protein
MQALLANVTKHRYARSVAVSNRPEALETARYGISLPLDMPEWISPIPAIIAAQLFTYHLGTIKGLDTDQPRGLSKVTKTV